MIVISHSYFNTSLRILFYIFCFKSTHLHIVTLRFLHIQIYMFSFFYFIYITQINIYFISPLCGHISITVTEDPKYLGNYILLLSSSMIFFLINHYILFCGHILTTATKNYIYLFKYNIFLLLGSIILRHLIYKHVKTFCIKYG